MENIMINLADEHLGVNEENKETWYIKDDLAADFALDMIREKKAEFKRFKMIVDAKIDQLMEAMEKEEKEMKKGVSFFEAKLHEYFSSIDMKKIKVTKTQGKYTLPSGQLIMKIRGPEYKRDNDKLVEYLEKERPELVKIKKSPDWVKYKKSIGNVDGVAVDLDTGEKLDCIKIVEREPEFKVEV
ncbi:host-nuclease inhibitor Gam family protein [Clostridium sp. D2Q-14]|uniref:host-nuclease inhibitor Gam family protein n=1 Tax=Anaeromonas gelatinilytica TaxID=2683194 RepID=UPI00193B7C6D|nr:host-nuclease inhibitor Gam family protein [Anaeromonas gelatinilytica]MBS4535967.1 host-nuclease inhibitor Gam family protein [Anaeromonas gelatinilytica]